MLSIAKQHQVAEGTLLAEVQVVRDGLRRLPWRAATLEHGKLGSSLHVRCSRFLVLDTSLEISSHELQVAAGTHARAQISTGSGCLRLPAKLPLTPGSFKYHPAHTRAHSAQPITSMQVRTLRSCSSSRSSFSLFDAFPSMQHGDGEGADQRWVTVKQKYTSFTASSLLPVSLSATEDSSHTLLITG